MLCPQLDSNTPVITADTMLDEIRRWNLRGRLYPRPRSVERRRALDSLAAAGLAARIPDTATIVGGWVAAPAPSDAATPPQPNCRVPGLA
jgi:hypothetical protein